MTSGAPMSSGEDLGVAAKLLLGAEAIHQEVDDPTALRGPPEVDELPASRSRAASST